MRTILWPLRLIGGLLRLGTGTAVVVVFLFMMAFNIAAITVPAITAAVSAAAGAVGIKTVAARQASALAAAEAKNVAQAAEIERQSRALTAEKQTTKRQRALIRDQGTALEQEKRRAASQEAEISKERQARDVARRRAASRADIIRRHRKALGKTVARVSARTALSATRSVSASFGQSIPVIGAAVVASVTALELYEACETMKNLAALTAEFDKDLRSDEKVATTPSPQERLPDGATLTAEASRICGLSVPPAEELLERAYTDAAHIWREMRAMNLVLPSWAEVGARLPDLELPTWPPDAALPTVRDLSEAVRGLWDSGADLPEPSSIEPTQ